MTNVSYSGNATVVFEDRNVTVVDGAINDVLAAYGTGVYRFPPITSRCVHHSVISPPSLTLPLHAAVSLPATCLRTLPLSKSPVLAVRMEHISVFPLTLPALTLLTQGLLVCDSETACKSQSCYFSLSSLSVDGLHSLRLVTATRQGGHQVHPYPVTVQV